MIDNDLQEIYNLENVEIFNSKDELCNTAIVGGVFIKDGKPFRISRELFEDYKKYIQLE